MSTTGNSSLAIAKVFKAIRALIANEGLELSVSFDEQAYSFIFPEQELPSEIHRIIREISFVDISVMVAKISQRDIQAVRSTL